METYEETRSLVRIGEKVKKKFWTEKKVRQECPLSPMLFNLLIGEEGLRKNEVGGVKLGGRKLKVLGYTDNLMVLAEEKEGIRLLINRKCGEVYR